MSFDDLIGLLIFLLFVGVPLFNRIRRGRGRSGRAPQRPARPSAPPTQASDAPPPTPSAMEVDPEDPIARRLEEARRRVEAARGGQAQTQTPTPASTAQQTTSAAPPSAPAATPEPFLPPTVVVSQPPPAIPRFVRTATPTSEPMKVERRRRRPRPYAIDAPTPSMHPDDLLRLEADDIVRGILWHQILSEPVAFKRRGRGRTPSQPPSP